MLSGGNNRLAATSTITVTGGVLDLGGNSQTTSQLVTFQGGTTQDGTLETIGIYGAYTASAGLVSANLAGSGSLAVVKTGGGVLTLTGANTYLGMTWLYSGTLCFSSGALGVGGAIVFFGDSTLQWAVGNTDDISSRLYINDGVHATLDTNGNTVTLATGFGGSPSGSTAGYLTKTGAGTLILGGANGYSGGTTVSVGTLKVGNISAIPSGTGKGNLAVNGTLDLNGYSVTVNGVTGSGTVTSSVPGAVTLTAGANNQTSTFSGVIQTGSGTVALTKTGTGVLTLSGNSTYTGPTDVQGGTLCLNGNLNSPVTDHGGNVTGWFFRDPDLAAAVREALGMPVDAILTIGDVERLTSLSADSNLISDLKGLENATDLESLTLVPGDFSIPGHLAESQYSASLVWLSGLANLKSVTLEGCGLTASVLGTLGDPDALKSLDVRYNSIDAIPAGVAALPSLTSLYIYGNPFPEHPATNPVGSPAFGALKGKPNIQIDLAPDQPEKATSVADLAASLYYLPVEMYEYVTNTIEFQPYAGAMKGALAVMQTGAGNDWDTDSLLAELFDEANVSVSYVYGAIRVPIGEAMAYVGVLDANAAVNVLTYAGLGAGLDGDSIAFGHTWLQTAIGGTTYKFDPSWKFRDFQQGLGNMLADVPFNYTANGDYLSEVRVETAAEYYAEAIREYLANPANGLTDKTIADVAYDGPIHQQVVTSLPTELPYVTYFENTPVSSIPSASTHQVLVELMSGGQDITPLFTLPDVSLDQLTIDPNISGDYAQPRLLRNGASVAMFSSPILKTATLTVTVTHYLGTTQIASTEYTRQADQHLAIGLNANQTSDRMHADAWTAVNEAQVSKADGGSPNNDELIGSLLFLDATAYYHDLNQSTKRIADLTGSIPFYNHVGSCLVTSTTQLQSSPRHAFRQFPICPSRW